MSNFIEKCLSREVGYDDIDDFIEQWHQASNETSIFDFLGMTRREYALWVVEPDVLPTIVSVHAQNKNLDQIFEAFAHELPVSPTSSSSNSRELIEWLKKSKLWTLAAVS